MKKALLLSDMKENEILKLLGLTEKQMRGIRAYRKLPEERLDTVMSILIEAMNRTKISFGNERNLFIRLCKIDYIIIGRQTEISDDRAWVFYCHVSRSRIAVHHNRYTSI